MKTDITLIIFGIIAIISGARCDCGCLQCSKHLRVVSPPNHPCKIIYRGPPCPSKLVQREMAFDVQVPVASAPSVASDSALEVKVFPYVFGRDKPKVEESGAVYSFDVQTPVAAPASQPSTTVQLLARPDRVVMPAPGCETAQIAQPAPQPINFVKSNCFPTLVPLVNAYYPAFMQRQIPVQQKTVVTHPGPLIEKLPSDYFKQLCSCRYGSSRSRRKRDLPILSRSLHFIMNLLPGFLRFPLEHTFKALNYHGHPPNDKFYRYPMRYPYQYPYQHIRDPLLGNRIMKSEKQMSFINNNSIKPTRGSLLSKLEKINHERYRRSTTDQQNSTNVELRVKRSLIFNHNDLSLPFFKITSIEDDDVESSTSNEDSTSSQSNEADFDPKIEYMKPLNFPQFIPHNPIFYILNTPLRLLRHFHQFGKHLSPVVQSVPQVLINSKRYLRSFGKTFKNDVLNIASNLIGDFDDVGGYVDYNQHHRMKRSLDTNATSTTNRRLESYEPEYSLVFNPNSRSKRYILKVCDEDEVEEYLREKLEDLVEPHKKKKKLKVEKLDSKIIIDNKGRPFVEINGSKRPIFRRRNKDNNEEKEEEESTSKNVSGEDVKDKITALIDEAKERVGATATEMYQSEVSVKIIKERINEILSEIQDLININFDQYSKIYNDLCKLQSFKEYVVNDWKKILINEKGDTLSAQIRILDDFKEMQSLKDQAVNDIAAVLTNGSSFMTKKLIKILVRLQKLQCIIYRVVEDFEEKIKMGTNSDVGKDIKYADFLSSLHFVVSKSKHDLQDDLKKERDKALELQIKILEDLRSLLDLDQDLSSENDKLYDAAKLLWEIKNLEKLQKDTIAEMNEKISRNQKVRKELKILFDLLRQLENCEEKQLKLLETKTKIKIRKDQKSLEVEEFEIEPQKYKTKIRNNKFKDNLKIYTEFKNKLFPRRTIIEDKKPVQLFSNGYRVTAYKVTDGFDS